jgi:uncharacterized hydrophobic protein (TIGR00341 family)
MSLRFVQIYLPADEGQKLKEILEDREVLGTWRDQYENDRDVFHLLVPANEVEPIMDKLEEEFSRLDTFHLILLDVEAVVPNPEKEENDEQVISSNSSSDATSAGRVSREELYNDILDGSSIDRVYLAMAALSTIVAAFGLIGDDDAVIIGAMVIAPLLGPNMAMALATTLGDWRLLRKAAVANLVGLLLSFVVAYVLGLIFGIDPEIPSVKSRTSINYATLGLALAAGSAGTFAFTRGLSNAVIGVMVAVALVPPLVAFGMLTGAGHYYAATKAGWLVAANVVCINLAGVGTFLAQGVMPNKWHDPAKATRATVIAVSFWVVMLIALVVVIYFAGGE